MNTEVKRFGYTAPTVMGGSGVVPRSINGDAAEVTLGRKTIALLCDADVGEIERRYGLPFRGDTWIVRNGKNEWVVVDAPPWEPEGEW